MTPLPTRIGTSATAPRTRLTSASGVAWPVAGPGDDERVGQSAVHEIPRGLVDVDRAQRHRVLAADVGEDRHVGAEQAPVAERAVRVGLHDALVGEHRAGVDVDADEFGADRGGDGQRRARVVLQHVHAERGSRQRSADLGGDHADGRHGGRLDAPGRERRVAEVLDEHRVHAALDEGVGVGECGGHDARHRPVPSRAAGQRREVDHADDRALESHQR